MARAFLCDRCRELFRGLPVNQLDVGVPWLPKKHSYSTDVRLRVVNFHDAYSDYGARTGEPDLCQQCFIAIIIYALRTLDPTIGKEVEA